MRSQTLNILLKFTFTPLGLLAEQDREGLWRSHGRGGKAAGATCTQRKHQESQQAGCKVGRRKDLPLGWGTESGDMGSEEMG